MERALHSQDVVKAVLSYLDHYTLLRRGARVSRGWQRVIEAGGLGEEACRLAFWSHYRSQDECYPNDFATISTSSFSWRKECKSRRLNGWSPREDIVGPSTGPSLITGLPIHPTSQHCLHPHGDSYYNLSV